METKKQQDNLMNPKTLSKNTRTQIKIRNEFEPNHIIIIISCIQFVCYPLARFVLSLCLTTYTHYAVSS